MGVAGIAETALRIMESRYMNGASGADGGGVVSDTGSGGIIRL